MMLPKSQCVCENRRTGISYAALMYNIDAMSSFNTTGSSYTTSPIRSFSFCSVLKATVTVISCPCGKSRTHLGSIVKPVPIKDSSSISNEIGNGEMALIVNSLENFFPNTMFPISNTYRDKTWPSYVNNDSLETSRRG